jgi:NitT/TauT family transport system ATP-binding protein
MAGQCQRLSTSDKALAQVGCSGMVLALQQGMPNCLPVNHPILASARRSEADQAEVQRVLMQSESLGAEETRGSPLLALSHVDFSFPAAGGRSIRVLKDVSLSFHPRETVALLGPSGCGKSTLLRVIAGLLTPNGGRRSVDASLEDSALAISMSFQRPVLLPWLSVSQNALLPFELARQPITGEAVERLERLLQIVGLYGFRHALPAELSGGMLMRAALVRAFVTKPFLVLMDEPFASLDEVTRNRLCVEFMELARGEGTAVVFVTHNIQEAVFVANRVVLLSARPGHVVSTLTIGLPTQRADELRRSAHFLDLCDQLYSEITHG